MSDAKGRYILTLPLKTEVYQEHILEKRFRLGEHLYNNVIKLSLDTILYPGLYLRYS